MTAYDPSQWTDLFVATAGASAALAGLVFVAVSINLERILSYEGLPERALETLLLLVGVLIFSILALMPGQSAVALGAEVLALGLLLFTAVFRLPAPSIRRPGKSRRTGGRAGSWSGRLGRSPSLSAESASCSKPAAVSTGSPPGSSARSPAGSPTPGSSWSRSSAEDAGPPRPP